MAGHLEAAVDSRELGTADLDVRELREFLGGNGRSLFRAVLIEKGSQEFRHLRGLTDLNLGPTHDMDELPILEEQHRGGGRAGPFHLVHASNLRPVKRIADIIRVFKLVQEQVDARLSIVGDGPEKELAKELTSQLDLRGKVSFLPPQDEMPKILRSAHLGLLLSDYVSFGLFALESLACGTPVAATMGGGLPEVVTHGETGVMCEVGKIDCIAEEIAGLLRDRGMWEQMSGCAAAVALERFSADRIVKQFEELYERLVTG